jgi:hypothetical protein
MRRFDCVAQIRRNAPRALGIPCILPLNRQGEAESPYSLISHSKADDRVGKWIDSTANSQSGRITEMLLSTGRVG